MNSNGKLFYICVLLLSIAFIIVGNRVVSTDINIGNYTGGIEYFSGVVTEIIERTERQDDPEWTLDFNIIDITFLAHINSGERRGDQVAVQQHLSDMFLVNEREVSVGDRVLLVYTGSATGYFFANYARINNVAILAGAFLVLVILFGRKKGFNAIVALGFTCMAVFFVFIPAILSGMNTYITTIVICIYAIISTLLIVIGPNKKAVSAIFGCLGGVFLAGTLMLIMDNILMLTGILDQETQNLLLLPTENPINLRAIIFAGVIIGAVGAIMDVAMSIASSLWEVKEAGQDADFASIFKSGINIGKDILGTMLNTLILAYIGSSLSLILLITVHTTSYLELFNMEIIIVEFLRALVGSFGMFFTIPLTAGICGWLYTRYNKYEDCLRYDENQR